MTLDCEGNVVQEINGVVLRKCGNIDMSRSLSKSIQVYWKNGMLNQILRTHCMNSSKKVAIVKERDGCFVSITNMNEDSLDIIFEDFDIDNSSFENSSGGSEEATEEEEYEESEESEESENWDDEDDEPEDLSDDDEGSEDSHEDEESDDYESNQDISEIPGYDPFEETLD